MSESISNLHIYKEARLLEDQVYELVKAFPAEEFYGLANDLRRSSAAVSHHIMVTFRLYSLRLKLDELSAMRHEAELAKVQVEKARELLTPAVADVLVNDLTNIIKQSWGLTAWIKAKLMGRQARAEEAAGREA